MRSEKEIRDRLEKERVELKTLKTYGPEYFDLLLVIETLEWALGERLK